MNSSQRAALPNIPAESEGRCKIHTQIQINVKEESPIKHGTVVSNTHCTTLLIALVTT